MSPVFAYVLSFCGMALLAATSQRHVGVVVGGPPPGPRLLGARMGAGLLILSALPCLWGWGAAIAVAAWIGQLAFAALAVLLLLAYRPGLLGVLVRPVFGHPPSDQAQRPQGGPGGQQP